jgi:hypothetical protein
MKDRGALLLLIMGLFLVLIYFSMFGFSDSEPTRWGQYASIGAICFFIIDEFFKS